MGELRESKKRETRQRLSDIATAMFYERGFDAVTVEEIAAELGITAGGSKSQLFKARAKLRTLLAHLVDGASDTKLHKSSSHVAPVY